MSDIDFASRRGILFDFDGTLADTKQTICTIVHDVLLEFGMTEEEIGDTTPLVGPSFPLAFCDHYGMSVEMARAVTERYRGIYNNIGPSAWPAFDGIHELLGRLRDAGKMLSIASSKNMKTLTLAIDDNDFGPYFDVVSGKVEDERDTKAIAIQRAMERMGLTADECVMVGDRCFDVVAAAECGIPCIGVMYGETCPRSELEDAGASIIVDTVDELGRILLGP